MFKVDNKIKLVIWDLDETFWNGTLSEGEIEYIQSNHNLVIELTNRGIVNSISSKNDFNNVKTTLEKHGIWEYFVFPSIDWTPKGQMVNQIIEKMNLRPDNVLFIDDNLMNLNEVSYMNNNINLCEPKFIFKLLDLEYLKGKDDLKHSRLIQYKNLEKKVNDFKSSKGSNIDFLKSSNILVSLSNNCLDEINRISELVERTNQLNYTKLRDSKETLISKIKNTDNKSGYISVKDKYGDYGIVGFYLIIKSNELEHFLFSCRTLNMFIESWLYRKLNMPKLNIIGEVATSLDRCTNLNFIKNVNLSKEENNLKSLKNKNVLIMGGCDLSQAIHYLKLQNIDTEFNYVNTNNISVHKEHTTLIKGFLEKEEEYKKLFKNIPIFEEKDVDLKLYNEDWDILIYSPLNDYSRGLYKCKENTLRIPFDPFTIDWTKKKNWTNLPLHLKDLPLSFLEYLYKNFSFDGPISCNEFEENINWILNKYSEKEFIFLTGSIVGITNEGNQLEMRDRHILMNEVLYKLESKFDNLKLVDVTKFVKEKEDHIENNIRHYSRIKYKELADEIMQKLLSLKNAISPDKEFYLNLINFYNTLNIIKNSKEDIILYGYGSIGKLIFTFLNKQIIGVIDKNLNEDFIDEVKVMSVKDLKNTKAKLLISPFIYNTEIIKELKKYTNNFILLY